MPTAFAESSERYDAAGDDGSKASTDQQSASAETDVSSSSAVHPTFAAEGHTGDNNAYLSPKRNQVSKRPTSIATTQGDAAAGDRRNSTAVRINPDKQRPAGKDDVSRPRENEIVKRGASGHVNGTPAKRPRLDEDIDTDYKEQNKSPMKEITVRRDSLQNDLQGRLRKAPDDLDKATFQLFKEDLEKNGTEGYLNDDEITAFMIRMNRVADQQAEYQGNIAADSDGSNTTLFQEIIREEEDLAVGQAFFKDVVARIKREASCDIDPRTVAWLRRACGLRRSMVDAQLRETANEAGKGERAVKTRMSARQHKIQKRDEGIVTLAKALDDLEDDFGKFEAFKVKCKRETVVSRSPDKDPPQRRIVKTENKVLFAKMSTKQVLANGLAFENVRNVRIMRVVVNGALFSRGGHTTDSPLTTKATEPLLRNKAVAQRSAKAPASRATAFDMSLKREQWMRNRSKSTSGNAFKASETTKEHYTEVVTTKIPRALKAVGVRFRFPRWETLNTDSAMISNPPRERHTDDVYAALCVKTVRSLNRSCRSWSMREFFYSDIDREWFSRNDVLEEAARLGLRRDVRLTSHEWRVIRRRLRWKPRRFARSFVKSQLEDLQDYRARVRMVHKSHLEDPRNNQVRASLKLKEQQHLSNMRYDVPDIIPFGTIVTAYSTKYRSLQRGTVLAYEPRKLSYLVLFDRKEFGVEFCMDYYVATHGGPDVLVIGSARRDGVTDVLSSGSAKGTMADALCAPHIEVQSELSKALAFDSHLKPALGVKAVTTSNVGDTRMEAIRHVAEADTLTGLLTVIDAATQRKEFLLGALEEVNLVCNTVTVTSQQLQYSHDWLRNSLVATNQVLEAALPKLRLMYGRLYMPSPASPIPRNQDQRSGSNGSDTFVEKSLDVIMEPGKPSSHIGTAWATRLAAEASYVSEEMSSLVLKLPPLNKRPAQADEDCGFEEDRLKQVGKVLLAASYGHRFSSVSDIADHLPLESALVVGSQRLLVLPNVPDVADADDLYNEVKMGHDAAAADLREAFALLQTEVILAAARKALPKPVHDRFGVKSCKVEV